MALITIVDENDNPIGSCERKFVYKYGLFHRIVRVLLFNDKGEVCLQWRSKEEDTFPETWDQSAGGHVDAGEDYLTAAKRELAEELGVDTELEEIYGFKTESVIGEKIIKRFNRVFRGVYNGPLSLQEDEVSEVRWFGWDELKNEIKDHPENFTPGLRDIVAEVDH